MNEIENYPYLPIQQGNTLVLTKTDRVQRRGMDNDDYYLDEVDSNNMIIAKYHVWHHLNIHPPQNTNEGWIKYNLEGAKISEGNSLK